MTLVVARIVGEQIAVAADTMITIHNTPLPLSKGVVKSCMLPGGICVSYAGSTDLASKDIWRFSKRFPHGADFIEAIEFFEQSSKTTHNDYIVAFAKNPRIVKITGGLRQSNVSKTQWIGDKAAYELFRSHEANVRKKIERGRAISGVLMANEPSGSPASGLYSVMRHVIRESEAKTVGGFVTLVSNAEGNFRHPCLSDMLFDWPVNEPPDFELRLEDKISFGSSGENADYSVSVFTTGYADLTFIGFYMLRGKIAYIFHPTRTLVADTCTVIKDVTPSDLPKRLTETFGRDYGWLIWIAGPSPASKSTQRYNDSNSEGGNQIGFMMHCNTFPAADSTRVLPPLNLYFPGPAE